MSILQNNNRFMVVVSISLYLVLFGHTRVIAQNNVTQPRSSQFSLDDEQSESQNTPIINNLDNSDLEENYDLIASIITDESLYKESLILRSIGTPLIKTGEVLIGVSVATWAAWSISTAIGGLLSGAYFDVGGVLEGLDIVTNSALNQTLLGSSIALTATGLIAFVVGEVMNITGNSYYERSFLKIYDTAPQQ